MKTMPVGASSFSKSAARPICCQRPPPGRPTTHQPPGPSCQASTAGLTLPELSDHALLEFATACPWPRPPAGQACPAPSSGGWSYPAVQGQGGVQQQHLLAAAAAKLYVLYQQMLLAFQLVLDGQDHRLQSNVAGLSGTFSDRSVSQQAPARSWAHWWRYQGL